MAGVAGTAIHHVSAHKQMIDSHRRRVDAGAAATARLTSRPLTLTGHWNNQQQNKPGRRRGLRSATTGSAVIGIDWGQTDSGRRDADTQRHAVRQQGSLIAIQDK